MAGPRNTNRKDKKPKRPEPVAMVEIISTEVAEVTETPVFSIDGEIYTMPIPVSASLSLQAMDMMAREGEVVAMMWVVEELVGTEGYEALKSCEALTTEQLEQILEKIQYHVMGELEEGVRGN